ncbi:MAG: hypothetical protein H7Z72_23860 [Bacteroidetes bacterium]|nr:hypothetical protein [Fibrella sp.]
MMNVFSPRRFTYNKILATVNTLTIQLPDSIDPALARWELARSLYEKEKLTLEEAAKLAGLAPVYFRMKLEGIETGVRLAVTHKPSRPFDPERIKKLAEEMDIQESWEELVAMIGK